MLSKRDNGMLAEYPVGTRVTTERFGGGVVFGHWREQILIVFDKHDSELFDSEHFPDAPKGERCKLYIAMPQWNEFHDFNSDTKLEKEVTE